MTGQAFFRTQDLPNRWLVSIRSAVFTEKISILVPGGVIQCIDIQASADEGDDDIARRMAKTFPVGTIVGVSGEKWRITSKDPPRVELLGAGPSRLPREEVLEAARQPVVRPEGLPPSEPHTVVEYEPGQVWKPKDPRRKSGFTIKAVTPTEVVAEDGRTVSLERMKRYDRVS